jgi:hypothetical protein
MGGAVLSSAISDSSGRFLASYRAGSLRLIANKPGYKSRPFDCSFDQPQGSRTKQWMLPPETPGLYSNGKLIPQTPIIFTKAGMVGMRIPAYYDGTYAVGGAAQVVTVDESVGLCYVPENAVTLGQNMFAGPSGLHAFEVGSDGVFVTYAQGRSSGRRIEIALQPVIEEVDAGYGGLVQQNVQVFRLTTALSPGEYVLFQGSGNVLDNEPHPDRKGNCWHVMVTAKQ